MNSTAFIKTPLNRTIVKPAVAIAMLFLMTAAIPSIAWGQRDEDRPNIEDLLPETTVAFVQIADIRDFIEKAGDGAMMQMLNDEEVAPLYERVVDEGRKAYGKVEEKVGLSLEEIQSLPSGEMVLCAIAPRRKNPVYMVIVEVGEDNEVVDKALDIARDKMSEAGLEKDDEELESGVEVEKFNIDGQQVYMAKRDGLIIGCSDETVLNNFFLRWDGEEVKKVRPLSKNRKFITIMNRCRSEKDLPNDVRFFFDPIATYKSAAKGNIGMSAAIAFFNPIGLDTIRAIGGSMILGDEEYEAILHGHLLLSSPRKGITKVISLKPDDYQPELWMPKDAMFYSTTSWDVPQMFQELRGIFDLTMEEGTFDTFITENIDDRLEMSLEEDILSQLSGQLSMSQIAAQPGKLNSASWIFGLGLTDSEKATVVVEDLITWLNENAGAGVEEFEYDGVKYWKTSEEVVAERTERRRKRREQRRARRGEEGDDDGDLMRATVRMPEPHYSIIGGSLVICDSKEAFEMVVETYKGKKPGLANDEDFVKMAKQMTRLLGTDMPVALSYSQPKNQLLPMMQYANSDEARSYLGAMVEKEEGDGFWGTLKGVLDDHDLPSEDVLAKYIVPQGWFVTSDDTGYHLLWFQNRLQIEDE